MHHAVPTAGYAHTATGRARTNRAAHQRGIIAVLYQVTQLLVHSRSCARYQPTPSPPPLHLHPFNHAPQRCTHLAAVIDGISAAALASASTRSPTEGAEETTHVSSHVGGVGYSEVSRAASAAAPTTSQSSGGAVVYDVPDTPVLGFVTRLAAHTGRVAQSITTHAAKHLASLSATSPDDEDDEDRAAADAPKIVGTAADLASTVDAGSDTAPSVRRRRVGEPELVAADHGGVSASASSTALVNAAPLHAGGPASRRATESGGSGDGVESGGRGRERHGTVTQLQERRQDEGVVDAV